MAEEKEAFIERTEAAQKALEARADAIVAKIEASNHTWLYVSGAGLVLAVLVVWAVFS